MSELSAQSGEFVPVERDLLAKLPSTWRQQRPSIEAVMEILQPQLAQNEFHGPAHVVRQLLAAHPNDRDLMALLGSLLASDSLAQYAESERLLRSAIAVDRSRAEDFDALLHAVEMQGDRDEDALAVIADAIKHHGHHHHFHAHMGMRLSNQQRYDDALPHLRRSQELNPDDVSVLLYLAYALFQSGNETEALALLRRVAELDAANAELYSTVHELFLGERTQVQGADYVAQRSSDEEAFFVSLAQRFIDKKDTDRAFVLLFNARDLLPNSTLIDKMLDSLSKSTTGRREEEEEEEEDYEKLCSVSPLLLLNECHPSSLL
jgi:Flp pilus assembly protein TadD